MGVILEFQGSDEELADNCFFCFVAVFVESSQDWVASSCHGWTLLSWLILLELWLFALHICSLKSSMCSCCFRTVALFYLVCGKIHFLYERNDLMWSCILYEWHCNSVNASVCWPRWMRVQMRLAYVKFCKCI